MPQWTFSYVDFRSARWLPYRNVYIIDNNNKISKGRVVRECEWGENSFVLWDVGIAGRDAYVRDSVVCVWCLSIVRITGQARITFPLVWNTCTAYGRYTTNNVRSLRTLPRRYDTDGRSVKIDYAYTTFVHTFCRSYNRKNQLYETLTQGSRAKIPKMRTTIFSASPSFLI